jgi:hypothetical protein
MSNKKNDLSGIKNIGMGILDTLNGIKEEESNSVNIPENKEVIEEKSRNVKKIRNKKIIEEKSKRSFMLTQTTIQKLNLLKLCLDDKDLGEIVEESINQYFQKNKKAIESLVEIYNQVK